MKTVIFSFLVVLGSFLPAQISYFNLVGDLADALNETSGLIYYNNHLYTHNDSGNTTELFELNPESGEIIRVITIMNVTNIDWEDLSQDEDYIYIGDIGNNSGNRTDLVVYKISKLSIESSNMVWADSITFTYADQTNFNNEYNNHNYDAEAMINYEGNIYLMTKNWLDQQTHIYQMPNEIGNQSAERILTLPVNVLVTSVSLNPSDNTLTVLGYSPFLTPLLIMVDNMEDIVNGIMPNIQIYNLSNDTLEIGSLVEGIALDSSTGRYYVTREKNSYLSLAPRLYSFTMNNNLNNITPEETEDELTQMFYPNPVQNEMIFTDKSNQTISIYDMNGRMVMEKNITGNMDVSGLDTGVYFVVQEGKNTEKMIKL